MHTEQGKRWTRRMKGANARHATAFRDTEPLRRLHASVYSQRRKWGTSVPLARTLVEGIVADSYVQNPDPFIELLSGAPDGTEQKLRDLFKSLHDSAGTKVILQRARKAAAVIPIVGHWTDFQQVSYPEKQIAKEPDEPIATNADEGTPPKKADTPIKVQQQNITGDLVLGYDLRFDPDGRRWDLRDHKWIARMYTRSLQDILDDESGAYTDEGKRMLRNWMRGKNSTMRPTQRMREESTSPPEDDPKYRPVNVWEIWGRPEKQVIHVPVGAEFHLGEYDWPKWWADANDGLGEYPLTIIATENQWQIPNEEGEEGFYGMPDLRLVRSPLENLPRLEAAFLDSVTNSARKFFGVDGLLDDKQITQLQTDENRAFMKIDLKTLSKTIAGGGQIDLQFFDLRKLVMELEQAGGEQAAKHLEAINHQLDLAYTLMGIGPGERGGVAPADSATESLGIQERLAVRTEKMVEDMADIADKITEKFWILLKGAATLPVRYRRVVADMDQSTWDVIMDPIAEFAGVDLVIRHHIGSSRPPNRVTIKAERKELFGLAAPILQASGDIQGMYEWMHWVVDAYDNKFASQMTRPELKEMAKQLLLALSNATQPNGPPITVQCADQLINAFKGFLGKYLSPPEIQQVAQMQVQAAGSQAPGPAGQGMGSQAKQPGPAEGSAAFAKARAQDGAAGGMTQ